MVDGHGADRRRRQMPPEAAEMMKDVKMAMNGSIWVAKSAPGVAEFMAFNKAALTRSCSRPSTGMKPGQSGGMDKLMDGAAVGARLPYLTEMTMAFEGTGPDGRGDEADGADEDDPEGRRRVDRRDRRRVFKVPEGYTIEKK